MLILVLANNMVVAGDGAAIRASNAAVVEIVNSTIAENVAGGNGGAARLDTGSMLLLTNVVVVGNQAVGSGGGISNYSAVLLATNCTVRCCTTWMTG